MLRAERAGGGDLGALLTRGEEGQPPTYGLPLRRRLLFFRPVSTTLKCFITLTIVALLVHTSLSISRNVDELSGATGASVVTEALSVAQRSCTFTPVLCVLFLACRMYVLAVTEGLGEPPDWVKYCMASATTGVVMQILATLILPVVTRPIEGMKLSDIAGEACDVHPQLQPLAFRVWVLRYLAWALQGLCMIVMYGGTLGVIVGIFTYDASSILSFPGVIAAVLMVGLYLLVSLAVWAVRSRRMQQADGPASDYPWERGLLSTSAAMRWVPMLAIVFLAARMRAFQLDPPRGRLVPYAQACFFLVAAAVVVNAEVSFYVGWRGKVKPCYYGIYRFSAPWWAHFLQHTSAGFVFLGVGALASSMFLTHPYTYQPFSHTAVAVLLLSGMYFFVHVLQWAADACEDLGGWSNEIVQNTIKAANVGVSLAPILCVLFLGCRMRALQITEMRGTPQGWAQDAMYICTFATITQVLCCLALPIFTGQATQTDEDGNARHDLRPMVGAYAVTFVKYVALLLLHGGICAVCVSIFLITPESAENDRSMAFKNIYAFVVTLCLISVVVTVALVLSSGKVVGLAVKLAIQELDKELLGVVVTSEQVSISFCQGYVNIVDLVVHNPRDQGFTSDHMVKVGRVVLRLNIWRLIRSLGRSFDIRTLVLHDVEVVYEKGGWSASNVNWLIDYLSKHGLADAAAAWAAAVPDIGHVEVAVHEVDITNVGARAAWTGVGTVLRVPIADMHYEDFSGRLCKSDKVQEIVVELLKTLLKATIQNAGHLGGGVAGGVKATLKCMMRHVTGRGSSARSGDDEARGAREEFHDCSG